MSLLRFLTVVFLGFVGFFGAKPVQATPEKMSQMELDQKSTTLGPSP